MSCSLALSLPRLRSWTASFYFSKIFGGIFLAAALKSRDTSTLLRTASFVKDFEAAAFIGTIFKLPSF